MVPNRARPLYQQKHVIETPVDFTIVKYMEKPMMTTDFFSLKKSFAAALPFLDQERRIREMLSIVEGNTDEVRNSEGGEEKATPSVAKARYKKNKDMYELMVMKLH